VPLSLCCLPRSGECSLPDQGDDPPEDFFLLGAGLSYHPNAADEIFVRYDGAWAADDTRQCRHRRRKIPLLLMR
jgi:hypothetical protein